MNAPYFEALRRYLEERNLAFSIPGHAGGKGALPEFSTLIRDHGLACDITEVPGIDDLHAPGGQCGQAQALAAELYGADHTYFLVNGSTAGNQAMLLSTLGPEDTVLVPQASHRSVFAGLVLCGATACILPGRFHPEQLSCLPPTPEVIAAAPDAAALFLTHPTYHGACADLEGIIRVARSRNMLVLVDEAWGSHLGFHPNSPISAVRAGADMVVQSAHKMTSALTQGAMLHVSGERVDRGRLRTVLTHLQTSSPSSLIVASLDCARAQMALEGRERLERVLQVAEDVLERLGGVRGLRVFTHQDPTRISLNACARGLSGLALERFLRERKIQVEMSELHQVLLVLSPHHTPEDLEHLVRALKEMPTRLPPVKQDELAPPLALKEPLTINPREIFFAPRKTVSLEKALDQTSAELLYCYPPGVPLLYPGQRFCAEKLEHIRTLKRLGGSVQGGADPTLQTVTIVDNRHDRA